MIPKSHPYFRRISFDVNFRIILHAQNKQLSNVNPNLLFHIIVFLFYLMFSLAKFPPAQNVIDYPFCFATYRHTTPSVSQSWKLKFRTITA